MSENPPVYRKQVEEMENLREYPDAPHLKILTRETEIERVLTEEEGGGRESVEIVVECDGKEHTKTRERITYNNQGGMTKVEELEKTDLGPCTCADGLHNDKNPLSQAA